jgi:hypothetical protein
MDRIANPCDPAGKCTSWSSFGEPSNDPEALYEELCSFTLDQYSFCPSSTKVDCFEYQVVEEKSTSTNEDELSAEDEVIKNGYKEKRFAKE